MASLVGDTERRRRGNQLNANQTYSWLTQKTMVVLRAQVILAGKKYRCKMFLTSRNPSLFILNLGLVLVSAKAVILVTQGL